MRMYKEDTAALVVDIQERLQPSLHNGGEMVANSAKLIRGLRILEVPVLVVRQYPKGLGELLPEIREALGEHTPMDKLSFSACGETEILDSLRAAERKNILLMGAETHVCVLQSVLDLKAEGYQPVLVCDCLTSRRPQDAEIALRRAEAEGATLTTSESVLFELLQRAGTETFKKISALVK